MPMTPSGFVGQHGTPIKFIEWESHPGAKAVTHLDTAFTVRFDGDDYNFFGRYGDNNWPAQVGPYMAAIGVETKGIWAYTKLKELYAAAGITREPTWQEVVDCAVEMFPDGDPNRGGTKPKDRVIAPGTPGSGTKDDPWLIDEPSRLAGELWTERFGIGAAWFRNTASKPPDQVPPTPIPEPPKPTTPAHEVVDLVLQQLFKLVPEWVDDQGIQMGKGQRSAVRRFLFFASKRLLG